MKKFIPYIILMSMIVTAFPLFNVMAQDNAIISESFEEKISWLKISSAITEDIFEKSDKDKTVGSYSLKVWDGSDQTVSGVRSGMKQIENYYNYTLKADINLLSGSATLILRTYNAEKKEAGRVSYAISDTGWKSYTLDIMTKEDVFYIEVLVQTSTQNIGEFYLDNVLLTKGNKIFIPGDETSIANLDAAQPGDTFVIPDGIYENTDVIVKNKATADNPITIMSKNPGNVVFTGDSNITIKGSHIIISDILFNECTTQNPRYIVYFSVGSSYSQLKNCAFLNCNPSVISTETQQEQVYLRGEHHKITNCYFNGKRSIGRMINIDNIDLKDGEHLPGNQTVENCYFGNFINYKTTEEFKNSGYVNGFETIKIGSSSNSMNPSNSTVTGCFFEACNGEDELITTKSSENTYSYNTFYRSSGALHLRQGHNTVVNGNLFINDIEKIDVKLLRSSGIRVYDENHTITNNYFYNQPENTGAIFLDSATENGLVSEHAPIRNVNVSNNTLIGADCAIVAGMYYKNSEGKEVRKVPPHGEVKNNAIISYKGTLPLIYNGDTKDEAGDDLKHALSFDNNYVYGKALGYAGETPEGIINEPFPVTVIDNFIVPSNSTGADINELKKAPKSPFDIIPDWVKEKYYDTGIYTFEAADNDLLNDANAHINNLVWFKANYGIESGNGIIKLYKNGVLTEENPITIAYNPTLKFIATPDAGYLFENWYINGNKITAENQSTHGVSVTSNNELIITSHLEDINVTASFFEIPKKIEITKYDTLKVDIKFPQEGENITVIFADYEGEKLNNIKFIPVVTKYETTVPVPDGINLLTGDKIMVWKSFSTCTPLCIPYEVTGTEIILKN